MAKQDDASEKNGAPEKPGKRKIFVIIAGIVVLVAGGASAAYFTGLLGDLRPHDIAKANVDADSTVFYDLPEILVNLPNVERGSTFLKLRVSLELGSEQDARKIETMLPRIVDTFHVYLRELRVDDLKESVGIYRLRTELQNRIAAFTSPARVNAVLFKEIQVQRGS